MADDMDFDTVAAQLYAADRDEFIAARKARAAEAKAAGDTELAARLVKLRKPSTAAWLVNHVVGERADDVAALAELGRQLRQAHTDLDGARLRELTVRRRRDVSALVAHARTLAERHDVGASAAVLDQVRDTFDAAVADASAAAAVASGRLDTAVSATGMDEWLAAAPTTAPPRRTATADRSAGPDDTDTDTTDAASGTDGATDHAARDDVARQRRRRRQRKEAQDKAADAEAEAERARQQLADATADVDVAKATVRDLQSQLVHAQRRARDAVAAADTARREHDRARRAADAAQRDVLRLDRS